MSGSCRRPPRAQQAHRRVRIGIFAAGTLAILGTAVVLAVSPLRSLWAPPRAQGLEGEARQLIITMAGFDPPILRVPAGQPFTLRLVNPDTPYHTDGGGWHQFRVERLSVDVRVPPRSERTVRFAGVPAGAYEFDCDVCCGGKENPTMRGVIEARG